MIDTLQKRPDPDKPCDGSSTDRPTSEPTNKRFPNSPRIQYKGNPLHRCKKTKCHCPIIDELGLAYSSRAGPPVMLLGLNVPAPFIPWILRVILPRVTACGCCCTVTTRCSVTTRCCSVTRSRCSRGSRSLCGGCSRRSIVADREAGVNGKTGASLSGHDTFSPHAHIIIGCCAGTYP